MGKKLREKQGKGQEKNGVGYNLNSEIYVIDLQAQPLSPVFVCYIEKKLTILLMMQQSYYKNESLIPG